MAKPVEKGQIPQTPTNGTVLNPWNRHLSEEKRVFQASVLFSPRIPE